MWAISFVLALFIPIQQTFFITLFVQIVYYSTFESQSGSTPGKKIMNIELIDRASQSPTIGHALQRLLFRYIIPFGSLTVLFGGEAIHDRLSGTYVVSSTENCLEIEDENKVNSDGLDTEGVESAL